MLKNIVGPQQFPPLVAPPTTVIRDSTFAPAPAPQSDGSSTPTPTPKTEVVPATGSLPGLPPASGPAGSISFSYSVNPSATLMIAAVLLLFAMTSIPL